MIHCESTGTMIKCPHVKLDRLGIKVIKDLQVSRLNGSHSTNTEMYLKFGYMTNSRSSCLSLENSRIYLYFVHTQKKVTDFHTCQEFQNLFKTCRNHFATTEPLLNCRAGVQWEFDDHIKAVSTEDRWTQKDKNEEKIKEQNVYCKNNLITCWPLVTSLVFIYIIIFFSSWRNGVHANFLVIFLQCCQIFTSLGELSFLHTLTHVPVNKSTLGVHQIKFVIQTSPGLSNGCGVTQHTHSALNLRQITTRNYCGRLVVNSDLN